jgi:hypothetical protein
LYGKKTRDRLCTLFGFAPYLAGVVTEKEFVPFGFLSAAVCRHSHEDFLNAMHVGYTPRNIGSLVGGC